MKNIIICLMVFTMFSKFLTSQESYYCSTPYMDSIEIARDTTILKKRAELEIFINNFIKQKSDSSIKLIIPVVFHVLHQYGNERLHSSVFSTAIKKINDDYAALNHEANNVIDEFKDIIGNCNVEFRLAQVDPEGNCTNGVIYYDTPYTLNAGNALKYEIPNWDPSSYLNIWTVKSIESGAAAWAHYPGIKPAKDGIVCKYDRVIGNHVLSHEIGHYLNLMHPWGDSNTPELQSNCNIDDKVNDTPNTIGTYSCNLYQESCGSLDNTQNIMDYTTCRAMFTEGQVARMRATLNSDKNDRNQLWTEENLIETGTIDGYNNTNCVLMPDFNPTKTLIPQGSEINFTNYSVDNSNNEYEWFFQGAVQENSTEFSPLVKYNTPGIYSVSLKVKNKSDEKTLKKEQLITVLDTLAGIIAPTVIDMNDENFPHYPSDINKRWHFINNWKNNWEPYKKNDIKAIRIHNYQNPKNTESVMISPNIIIADVPNLEFLNFDLAYAKRTQNSNEKLRVYISSDYGKNWKMVYYKSGNSLVTNNGNYISNTFIPNDNEWRTETIDISSFKNNHSLMLKFVINSNKGNFLYIDNIGINKAVNINLSIQKPVFNIYPNPSNKQINIHLDIKTKKTAYIVISNVIGNIIWYKEKNGPITSTITHSLPKGVYFVTLLSDQDPITKKVIIQ